MGVCQTIALEGGKEKKDMLKQIKTILKTAVLIAKTSPWNLPAFIGSRFLEIVQPFVTLFFSAKILDLLTQGADR